MGWVADLANKTSRLPNSLEAASSGYPSPTEVVLLWLAYIFNGPTGIQGEAG